MSNINKQALREAAQEEIMLRSVSYTSDAWQDEASPEAVLALLDELEAADALNKHLELAIRRAEGCSEALRRKLEAAEERIAELSELPMKSDVEKKPQNTLSGRPVYLGDGSDAKETLIAGKRDIHRYGSLITDKAWKGD
ncbi:TPA: ead/Ea22-like family protein [Citrobacter braakii]|nr:ead/Ea22-like family protein [Citrobacter braakii]